MSNLSNSVLASQVCIIYQSSVFNGIVMYPYIHYITNLLYYYILNVYNILQFIYIYKVDWNDISQNKVDIYVRAIFVFPVDFYYINTSKNLKYTPSL